MPRVKVNQSGGTIGVARDGDPPVVREVSSDGIVEVASEDLQHFLTVVPEAELQAEPVQAPAGAEARRGGARPST